jgi:hypothetical protein
MGGPAILRRGSVIHGGPGQRMHELQMTLPRKDEPAGSFDLVDYLDVQFHFLRQAGDEPRLGRALRG